MGLGRGVGRRLGGREGGNEGGRLPLTFKKMAAEPRGAGRGGEGERGRGGERGGLGEGVTRPSGARAGFCFCLLEAVASRRKYDEGRVFRRRRGCCDDR